MINFDNVKDLYMKVNIQAVVDVAVREQFEALAKAENTTVSKYVARLLTQHLKNQVPRSPTESQDTVRQYDESDMTEEDFEQFRRALKFDPKLTVQSYLRWKHS